MSGQHMPGNTISRILGTVHGSPQWRKFVCTHQMFPCTLHFDVGPGTVELSHIGKSNLIKSAILHLKTCPDQCEGVEAASDGEGRHHGEREELLLVQHLPLYDGDGVGVGVGAGQGPPHLHVVCGHLGGQVGHSQLRASWGHV